MSKDYVTAIDRAVREGHYGAQDDRRGHLGASAIGNRCPRQAWYEFRWAYEERHTGRLLRLFNRGHEEEPRFARWLRMAGVEVQDYSERLLFNPAEGTYVCENWEEEGPRFDFDTGADLIDVSSSPHHIAMAGAPKQWHFVDHDGHFAGSSDGRIRAGEGCRLSLPEGWGLLECKTHGDKSFKQLTAKGVLSSKPTHYVQMQVYMHYFELDWAFYFAVNKNDDTLYAEVVHYKEEIAMWHIANAWKIIQAKEPPPRLTDDPSWFECKFCAFREICHYDETPQKNCRSCAFAQPVENGQWRCNKFNGILPKDFIPKGCDSWEPVG